MSDDASERQRSKEEMNSIMNAVSKALRGAISDTHRALDLLEQERLHPDQRSRIEHELERVLRALEGNLQNTEVGLSMFMAKKDDTPGLGGTDVGNKNGLG